MEDEGELELFFAIAWNIWHARNQRRMGEQEKPLQQIIAHATDLLMDFNKANKGLEHENRGGSKMDSPPPPLAGGPGIYKIILMGRSLKIRKHLALGL